GLDLAREAVRAGPLPVLSREQVVRGALAARAERDDTWGKRLDQPCEGEKHHRQRHSRHDQVGELARVHGLQSMRGHPLAVRGFLGLPLGVGGGWITDQPWARFGRSVWSRRSAPWSP